MNDYYGVCEWLRNSGFVIMAHNCPLQLPLSGNIEEGNFRMYLSDTSLLFASMDDEAQMMIRKIMIFPYTMELFMNPSLPPN